MTASERSHWNSLMKRHHYLGFHSLIGQSLWTEALRLQRLPLEANNCRFLILPNVTVPNLVSRVLSLNMKRLSEDWQAVHGHPIYLAETYIDPRFYQGTCYKAAGWLFLGNTRGFANHHGTYTHHGCVKSVFVRPLRQDALWKLADPSFRPPLKPMLTTMKLSEKDAYLLHKALLTIPDPRKARGIRHHRLAILSIAVCAIICGAKSFDAIAQWGQACSQKMRKRLRCRKSPETGLYETPTQ